MASETNTSEDPIQVVSFYEAISAFEPHMAPSLSYLAFRKSDGWHIFRALINYNFQGALLQPFDVRTPNVMAGLRVLEGGPSEARQCVREILEGALIINGEELKFPPQLEGGYALSHVPILPEGIERQFRIGRLQIRGSDQSDPLSHAPFDWELRAADTPYDGIGDLLGALNVPMHFDHTALFEALVYQIAAIDGASVVEGERARFRIALAPVLITRNPA